MKLKLWLFTAFSTVIFACPISSFGIEKTTCLISAVKNIFRPTPKIEHLTHSVDLVWFPESLHVETNVDGRLWDAYEGYDRGSSMASLQRRNSEFVKANIRVTESELNDLKEFLNAKEGKRGFQSCISGACKALNRSGIMYIPPPFSKVPMDAIAYLKLKNALGSRRVGRIEYFGTKKTSALLQAGFMEGIVINTVVGVFYLSAIREVSGIVTRAYVFIHSNPKPNKTANEEESHFWQISNFSP